MSFASGMKTIVVSTDLDGQSEAALEYARKLAAGYGARIVLAHGLAPMDYAAVDAVPGRVRRSLTDAARAALDAVTIHPFLTVIPLALLLPYVSLFSIVRSLLLNH